MYSYKYISHSILFLKKLETKESSVHGAETKRGKEERRERSKKFRERERGKGMTGENCFVFAGGIHIQQARYLTPSKEEARGEERRH